MRMLAHVEKVVRVFPIKKADFVEGVQVLGWTCVVKKGDLKEGDLCVYIEIDSVVPKEAMFDFLSDYHYRVKTVRRREQISQGLALPIDAEMQAKLGTWTEGDDVTEVLGITKYVMPEEVEEEVSAPLPKSGMGRLAQLLYRYAWFRWLYGKIYPKPDRGFPEWVGKTDEERIQTNPGKYLRMEGPMYVSEKLDGQSATYVIQRRRGIFKKYEFMICSRTSRKGLSSKGSFARVAELENIKSKMIDMLKDADPEISGIAIQGENIGPGIRKNRYRLTDYELRVFAIKLHIGDYKVRLDVFDMLKKCQIFGFRTVPIIDTNFTMLSTLEEMLDYSNGKSQLADVPREGVVIRKRDMSGSFKVVSNQFLLKEEP